MRSNLSLSVGVYSENSKGPRIIPTALTGAAFDFVILLYSLLFSDRNGQSFPFVRANAIHMWNIRYYQVIRNNSKTVGYHRNFSSEFWLQSSWVAHHILVYLRRQIMLFFVLEGTRCGIPGPGTSRPRHSHNTARLANSFSTFIATAKEGSLLLYKTSTQSCLSSWVRDRTWVFLMFP